MPTVHTSEVLRNTLTRISVALDAYKLGKLGKVRLFNHTTQSYGRSYYRIELWVELTEPLWFNYPAIFGEDPAPPKPLTEAQEASNKLHERLRYIPEYISFNQQYEAEKVVEAHYEWISALLEFHLRRAGVPLEIEYFETDIAREYKQEQEREKPKRDQEHQEFLRTYNFKGDVGDYAVVEDYSQVPKLIKLDRDKVHNSAPYSGQELKSDFTVGKRRVDYISESHVLAIFTDVQRVAIQQKLPFTRTKNAILQVVAESRSDLDLKYSKPQPPKSSVKTRKAYRTS